MSRTLLALLPALGLSLLGLLGPRAEAAGPLVLIEREAAQALLQKLSKRHYSLLRQLAQSPAVREAPEGAALLQSLTRSLGTLRALDQLIADAVPAERPTPPGAGAPASSGAPTAEGTTASAAEPPKSAQLLRPEELAKLGATLAAETDAAARRQRLETALLARALTVEQLAALLPSFGDQKLVAVKVAAAALRDPQNAGELAKVVGDSEEARAVLRALAATRP